MPSKRVKGAEAKNSEEFKEYILKTFQVNIEKGLVEGKGLYYKVHVEIAYKAKRSVISLSHLVWFLTHKKWPKDKHHIDHKDGNPLNNRPDNLDELTIEEHTNKKYGDNIGVSKSYRKQAKGWVIIRRIKADTKSGVTSIYLGTFKTEIEADNFVKEYKIFARDYDALEDI